MTAPEHVAGQLDLTGTPVPPKAVARPNPRRIYLTLEMNADLPPWECWPDGGPDLWGVEDLAASIEERTPTLRQFLNEWDMASFASLRITDDSGHTTWVDLP